MNPSKMGIISALTLVPVLLLCTYLKSPKKEDFIMIKTVTSLNELKKLFPTTPSQLVSLAQHAIKEAHQNVDTIMAIPLEQRTFDNTIAAYDKTVTIFSQARALIELFTLVHPDEQMRTIGQEQLISLQNEAVDLFAQNKNLYTMLNDYNIHNAPQENLSKKQKYFLEETLKDYERYGLNRDNQTRNKIAALRKELSEFELAFDKNIYSDNRTVAVHKDELTDLDDDFIAQLKQNEEGLYLLGVDYPTYHKVMDFCSNNHTRKKLYDAFNKRAYPANCSVLSTVIEKRHKLAELLGFNSFAHLALQDQMVKNPERVEEFLTNLVEKTVAKEQLEFERLIKNLPASVRLSPEGKLYPWDRSYVVQHYKKNNFNIDENKISHYFPMDNTIKELLAIYEQFLDLEFKEEAIDSLWHPEVKLITVYQNKQLQGYLLLDLHPRAHKYNHACHTTIIPALKTNEGIRPAVSVVIANFPHAIAGQPALLKRDDVNTFFHEFGHALHALLGATKLGSFSGTRVKTDFVEMPSQMLEEWLWDPAILKQISKHYKTGEQLPDETINTLIELKNLTSAGDIQRQLVFALVSLNYFKEGAQKDIYAIFKKFYEQIRKNDLFYDDCHFYTAFGHLMGYDAKYYSYLWSKVFALDLFEHIKSFGLLNTDIGTRYKNTILAKGGSKDPDELLYDFLGRAPTTDAFMRSLGL